MISALGHGQADAIARAYRQIKERGSADAGSAAASATPAAADPMAQLGRLGELRAQDILTDEEFQAQKTQILGRL